MTGKRAHEIAREVLGPDLTDGEVEFIMWERTGFPSFFDGDPETTFREQLIAALPSPSTRTPTPSSSAPA